jgi:hypothetical protein
MLRRRRLNYPKLCADKENHDADASTAVPLAEVSFLSPLSASWLFFAAAICQAGIAAPVRPLPNLLLAEDAELFGLSIAAAAVAGTVSAAAVWEPPTGPPVPFVGGTAVEDVPAGVPF